MELPIHARRAYDAVQIVADNTDVFNSRFGENPPPWARYALVGLSCVDTDWTMSVNAQGEEYARAAAPSAVAADNIGQNILLSEAVIMIPIRARANFDLICNINVTTGAAGVCWVCYIG